jgi:hypothetical protein
MKKNILITTKKKKIIEYNDNRDISFPYTKRRENRTEFIEENSSLKCSGEMGLSVTLNIFSTIQISTIKIHS